MPGYGSFQVTCFVPYCDGDAHVQTPRLPYVPREVEAPLTELSFLSVETLGDQLTLERVQRWLLDKAWDAVVGFPHSPTSCPLAQFVRERFGIRDEAMTDDAVWVSGARLSVSEFRPAELVRDNRTGKIKTVLQRPRQVAVTLPDTLAQFVRAVDTIAQGPVEAQLARLILTLAVETVTLLPLSDATDEFDDWQMALTRRFGYGGPYR